MNTVTCREAASLLPLFFDGELDPRQMRAVALHGTRCGTCEGELRQLERVQELVCATVTARADELDLTSFWTGIEQQLGAVRMPWWERVREWWSADEHRWAVRVPAFAVALAIAAFAVLLLTRAPQTAAPPDTSQVATNDYGASIEALDSDAESVAVLNDPETRSQALWVSEESIVGGVDDEGSIAGGDVP